MMGIQWDINTSCLDILPSNPYRSHDEFQVNVTGKEERENLFQPPSGRHNCYSCPVLILFLRITWKCLEIVRPCHYLLERPQILAIEERGHLTSRRFRSRIWIRSFSLPLDKQNDLGFHRPIVRNRPRH